MMELERKRLALLDAQDDFKEVKWWHSHTEKQIATNEELISDWSAEVQELKAQSAKQAEVLFNAGGAIAELNPE